jgi:hypothetical protein
MVMDRVERCVKKSRKLAAEVDLLEVAMGGLTARH